MHQFNMKINVKNNEQRVYSTLMDVCVLEEKLHLNINKVEYADIVSFDQALQKYFDTKISYHLSHNAY